MPVITKTIIATSIMQYDMDAVTALNTGLLSRTFTGGDWFTAWANKSPTDRVYVYVFGGIYGGFIYGQCADFETLAEFAACADAIAEQIWLELRSLAFEHEGA